MTRTIHVAIAATALAVPASALALSGAGASSAATPLQATVTPRSSHLGQLVTVSGTATPGASGQRAVLQTAPRTVGPWQTLQTGSVGSGGRIVFRRRLQHSGYLRIVVGAAEAPVSGTQAIPALGAAPMASAPQRVVVAARFAVANHDLEAQWGQMVKVGGALTPAGGGRVIRIQARRGRSWQTVSTARTRRNGRFTARVASGLVGNRRLRVHFAGDRSNAAASEAAGMLSVYTAALASWYEDAGSTACGFHATYGVANRTLPCGTRVKMRFGGRSVTAVVDDRGPYVGGRDWDLSQTTAGALGFGGVGTIWVSL